MVKASESSPSEVLFLNARDVTGSRRMPLEVDPNLSAGTVRETVVQAMSLPNDVTWGLRDDRSAYLDDARAIGDQVATGEEICVVPKAHLGAVRP